MAKSRIALIGLLVAGNAYAGDECMALLQYGIHDIFETNHSAKSAAEAQSELCSLEESRFDDQMVGRLRVKYKIFSGNVGADRQTLRQFKKASCDEKASASEQQEAAAGLVKKVNSELANAYVECQKVAKNGIEIQTSLD